MTRLIQVRPADWRDRWDLLKWRNDAETCAAFVQTARVGVNDHLSWLHDVLENPDVKLFVVRDSATDAGVGTFRLDRQTDGWHCSITVAPEHRGQGYAAPMLREMLGVATRYDGRLPLIADIKATNWKSLRAFKRAGFEMTCAGDMTRWTRPARHDIPQVPATLLGRLVKRVTRCWVRGHEPTVCGLLSSSSRSQIASCQQCGHLLLTAHQAELQHVANERPL